jgi:hypothetical protein
MDRLFFGLAALLKLLASFGGGGPTQSCTAPEAVANDDCAGRTLYRAVEQAELDDIVGSGSLYRVLPGTGDGKYFYATAEQAANFARLNRGREYTLTSADFPASVFADPEVWFGTIAGEGDAFFIPSRYFPHGPVRVHGPLP